MTLILTAFCKDGVCVCADKRYRIEEDKGAIKLEDNHKKIYKFTCIPLIVFNHGLNIINNKSWDGFCIDYERSNRWRNMNMYQIANDFWKFLEKDIQEELKRQKQKSNNKTKAVSFDLFGKTEYDEKYNGHELYWYFKDGQTGFEFIHNNRLRKEGLIRSGDGKKYLIQFLDKDIKYKKIDYWEELSISQARGILESIFTVAIKEQDRLKGNEFSKNYDIESI